MAAYEVLNCENNKRHVFMNDTNNEHMVSIYGDEFIHFDGKEKDLAQERETCLILTDKNNFEEEEDSEDEMVDEGVSDIGDENVCGEEGLVRIKTANATETLHPDYLSRQVCVIQSYAVIISSSGGVYSVCLKCHYQHALEVPMGKHHFVSNHYKRLMWCCGNDLHCKICEVPLFIMCPSHTCIVCNGAEIKKMENHVFNRENFT